MASFSPLPASTIHIRPLWLVLLVLVIGMTAGCAETGTMSTQPRYDPLSASSLFADGRSARGLIDGTVPQTEAQYGDPATTGVDANGNPVSPIPVEVTADLVARGQERFNIYCTVCHGQDGQGNGKVVTFGFPNPPNLLGDEAKALTAGDIFAIITNGKGNMFPYGYRVKAPDRWAIISYIRALQLKNGPFTGPLTQDELNQIGQQP